MSSGGLCKFIFPFVQLWLSAGVCALSERHPPSLHLSPAPLHPAKPQPGPVSGHTHKLSNVHASSSSFLFAGADPVKCFWSPSAARHPGPRPLHPADWWCDLWHFLNWHPVPHGSRGNQLVRDSQRILCREFSSFPTKQLFKNEKTICSSRK